jgi:hypothetical protein
MIEVHNKQVKIGDIVNTIEGRAKLTYVGRQAFSCWDLIDQTDRFVFGRPITVEDNNLDKFILPN